MFVTNQCEYRHSHLDMLLSRTPWNRKKCGQLPSNLSEILISRRRHQGSTPCPLRGCSPVWRHLYSPRDMVRLNAVSDYAVARVRHAVPDSPCLRASEVDPTFTASITLLGRYCGRHSAELLWSVSA